MGFSHVRSKYYLKNQSAYTVENGNERKYHDVFKKLIRIRKKSADAQQSKDQSCDEYHQKYQTESSELKSTNSMMPSRSTLDGTHQSETFGIVLIGKKDPKSIEDQRETSPDEFIMRIKVLTEPWRQVSNT